MPNRLAAEKSPYLLQHKDNPVDWYAWGSEAFEAARTEDKPIFLSIGYSTCHWCHVMEHESFENPEIAAALNRDFVSVKVDREERPDVDRVYMTFVQATTGSGGWPMSVWLTPQLEPFFGGTYFPPTSRWQRPGFVDVLQEIARLWKNDRLRIVQSAAALADQLRALGGRDGGAGVGGVPGPEVLDASRSHFASTFDARRGGFGNAPKFPRPSELLFLFREHARTGDAAARDMALHTLGAMALGGMRDHVGGGFHRYAVDAEWRVPHFEKMLYDQAQLVLAYLEAAQITGDAFFAGVAEDTLAYVRREMTDQEGGFYSAEDADSVPPDQAGQAGARKSEGAFYLWTAEELDSLLGGDAPVFKARYGIEPDGNAPEDPQGEFTGRNILYVARGVDEAARETGGTEDSASEALSRARLTLFTARLSRPRPHLDDKVLTSWNGLMIAAFARAGRVLRTAALGASPSAASAHLESARRAASFLRRTMWDEASGRLLRRYREGDAAIPGYAEDYACLAFGLLELFQADGDIGWLEWALALQQRLDERFGDRDGGGWFSTTGDDPSVLMRLKEDYDGAEPAASSVALANLLTIAHLTGGEAAPEQVRRTLAAFGPRLARFGPAAPFMLAVLSAWHAGLSQVVVAGPEDDVRTGRLLDVLAATYRPFMVTVRAAPEPDDRWRRLLPFAAAMTPVDGRPAAYVCRDFTCRQPVTEAEDLRAQFR